MTDKTFWVCLCAKSTSSAWHQCAASKICSVSFGMLSLYCLVWSVVDHMLLIASLWLFTCFRVTLLLHFVILSWGILSLVHVVCLWVVFLLFFHFLVYSLWYTCTIVSHNYAPPFATLASVQNAGGGLVRGMWRFLSRLGPPPLSGTDKARPHCRWEMRAKREALLSARRGDAPDATGRLKSFNVEGRGSRALPRSRWRVHRWCGQFAFAVDTLTVDSRVA